MVFDGNGYNVGFARYNGTNRNFFAGCRGKGTHFLGVVSCRLLSTSYNLGGGEESCGQSYNSINNHGNQGRGVMRSIIAKSGGAGLLPTPKGWAAFRGIAPPPPEPQPFTPAHPVALISTTSFEEQGVKLALESITKLGELSNLCLLAVHLFAWRVVIGWRKRAFCQRLKVPQVMQLILNHYARGTIAPRG